MKKTLLSIILTGTAATTMMAQSPITVVEWDVASVNTVIIQAHDTSPVFGPGPSGANATWNFAAAATHGTDTLLFTNPNWTPYLSYFPGSNLAVQFGSQDVYIYLNNTSTGLYVKGQYADLGAGPMALRMNPNEQIIEFPCTYNTDFTNTYTVDETIEFTQVP